jgi:uncharacterized protein YqjF (DUF2071 family)
MAPQLHPLTTPVPVHRPVMLQSWKKLTYVHWPVAPEQVDKNLPEGLAADTIDGSAWVGLVAFEMQRIRIPGTPAIPYFGTFPETNVRTYVLDSQGRPGVWFDSLDITRLLPVAVARTAYRLPYMWASMTIHEKNGHIEYRARRRWPGPRDASSRLAVAPGNAIADSDQSPLERFLTARWGLYTMMGRRLAYAPVDHPTWPLQNAELLILNDELVAAAGYSLPEKQPIVHYSAGVDVRIGLPKTVTV